MLGSKNLKTVLIVTKSQKLIKKKGSVDCNSRAIPSRNSVQDDYKKLVLFVILFLME